MDALYCMGVWVFVQHIKKALNLDSQQGTLPPGMCVQHALYRTE